MKKAISSLLIFVFALSLFLIPVSGVNHTTTAQNKIDEALALINTSTAPSKEVLVQVKAILEK